MRTIEKPLALKRLFPVATGLAIAIAAALCLQTPAVYGQAQPPPPLQPHFVPTEPANSPLGTAFGIKPGRVAWEFDPAATSWDGTSVAPGWGFPLHRKWHLPENYHP